MRVGRVVWGEGRELSSLALPPLPPPLQRLDFFDAWDFFDQEFFHSLFKGHLGHGTAFAGAGEHDFDDAVFDVHQLDIAAVPLQQGADLVQSFFHQFFHLKPPKKDE